MTDHLSTEKRSQNMSKVRSKGTELELQVRRRLHQAGFRFRLNSPDLPGKPDIVLPRFSTVIFVNGCFWHGHNCSRAKLPKTNTNFWKAKILKNISRDSKNQRTLRKSGWRVYNIWGCQQERDLARVLNFLKREK